MARPVSYYHHALVVRVACVLTYAHDTSGRPRRTRSTRWRDRLPNSRSVSGSAA